MDTTSSPIALRSYTAPPNPPVTFHVRRPPRRCAEPSVDVATEPETTAPRGTALVLSGSVAKGAFEAGAIRVLTQHGLPITKIVAASSGALNAALLAAGVRAGRPYDAARRLEELWSERATWTEGIDLSARDIVCGRGLSSSDKLRRLVRESIEEFVPGGASPIDLSLVVTALQGDPTVRHTEGATSFESVASFRGEDFDDAEARERLYSFVTASAAFPGLFAPVTIPDVGACLDGGSVNNTPIAHAVAGRPDIGRVIVVTHTPTVVDPPPLRGLDLAGHVADALITERLYRDLREARATNARLAALDALVCQGTLTRAEAQAAKAALGFALKRPLDVIEIRPDYALRGGAFAGLSSRALREEYIAAGRCAALDALSRLTP